MYTDIAAYSSGIGDCEFLFNLLGGVKTGCPLSSMLFLLGVNPIVFLFLLLSDTPKFSNTRICADDFGSVLRSLDTLMIQASVLRAARLASGLHLKPVKCVLIVSCTELNPALVQAIRAWLLVNTPEFADFAIQASGKYLGWHLGVNAVNISFVAPVNKFVNRIEEICLGRAPTIPSVLRYNQRAVSVLSYVAQFAVPPATSKLASLGQWAVHRILRLPPQSMPRDLMHSIGFCTIVEPLPLLSYCAAVQYRFAHSESEYLVGLYIKVMHDFESVFPCSQLQGWNLPDGNLNSPCILGALFDCLFAEMLSLTDGFLSTRARPSPPVCEASNQLRC